MSSALDELRIWAKSLKYWEQATLDRIVTGEDFTDEIYSQLSQYLIEDEGLGEKESPRPTLQFLTAQEPQEMPSGEIKLSKISNLQDVNALAPNQTLTFSPSLTAIYGANGSGKSGYARVLGCAGFTRGDKEILPDVTKPAASTSIPCADIEICQDDGETSFCYQMGDQCAELASFHVFDSTSVKVHLTEPNEFSFSPAGLSYLTELARQTDIVRRRLKENAKNLENPHEFGPLFQGGESKVTKIIEGLDADTDLKELKRIATLSAEEKEEIGKLDKAIANLKALDIPSQIKAISQKKTDIEKLVDLIQGAGNKLSDATKTKIIDGIKSYLGTEKVAKQLSVEQFKTDYFTQTGTNVWQSFIEAAKALADAESTPEQQYPQPGDRCLLCHHPLSTEAKNLLHRLWKFLEGEARSNLEEAQTVLSDLKETIDDINLDFYDKKSIYFRHINEHDKELSGQITSFIDSCKSWCQTALEGIADHKIDSFPFLPGDGIPQIKKIVKSLEEQLSELQKKNPEDEITKLSKKLINLRHREVLNANLSRIERYVISQALAVAISKMGGSTRHITIKHNELFEKLVTKGYLNLFKKNLDVLQRPINIKMGMIPRKGMTYRQVSLITDPDNPIEGATTDKVLSEGEKRAVSLADFLTEVELDPSSRGVILDDPVTSLDLEWRETIAEILAKAALNRQIVIFTHDLPFLYHLKKHAEKESVDIETHWIQRGDDDKPGYVYLDNSSALEKDYKKTDKVKKIYKQAKDSAPELQEAILRHGFGKLRSCYEAFIIFELFGGVVRRFEEEVRYKLLRNVVWDESIITEVMEKYDRLSGYIEAHLHSDTYAATKPSPKQFLSEIEEFESLKKRHKELRKQHKAV